MIVQCERCKTKFRLDESLLKEEGSKVRCSVCAHVFKVYPPEAPAIEPSMTEFEEEFQETVAIDSSAESREAPEAQEPKLEEEIDFDKAFESALYEKEVEVETTSEDLEGYEPEDFEKEVLGEAPEEIEKPEPELAEEPVVEAPPEEQVEVHLPRKKSRLGLVILIIAFVIVAGAAAIVYFVPQMIPESLSFLKMPEKKAVKDLGVRRLSFRAVTGSFVNTEHSGELFVVKGMVVNDYPKPRSFILVKASILDDKGNVVRSKMAYAGNSFSDEELKKLPYQEIEKLMKNPRGRDGSNVNVAGGASIPFMIVFQDLPSDLSEFSVEAVSSSPGR
ncbi:MAG TPA: DUF3426 domain-containing protein [Desulfobacteraceae bacterium]|nr:DUF3426 domain-containing protein [Desulfobacteraceae bacterium]